MDIHYLEIVTNKVDATCLSYSEAHGVSFGEPDQRLGLARTATLASGGTIGVRAPMSDQEHPIVRPYFLTIDIEKAILVAIDSGGELLHPKLAIPGLGAFAIYALDGIQHGLWQL